MFLANRLRTFRLPRPSLRDLLYAVGLGLVLLLAVVLTVFLERRDSWSQPAQEAEQIEGRYLAARDRRDVATAERFREQLEALCRQLQTREPQPGGASYDRTAARCSTAGVILPTRGP
jgi:hypothetical protein